MIIAIYVRQSKFKVQSESIENQISICKDYCNRYFTNFQLHIYRDEGYSGKDTIRPGFQEMLNDIPIKQIQFIVTYKLDRLCRSLKDFVQLIDIFQIYRVNFTSVKENFDLSSPTGKMIALMYSMFSELERDSIRERICDNMYESAKTGRRLGGPAPFGYKYLKVQENGKFKSYLEIDNNSISTVKYIYDNFLRLKSLTQVRNLAFKNKILGPKGNILDLSTISNILRNLTYVKSSPNVVDFLKSENIEVYGIPDNKSGFICYGKNSTIFDKPIATISKHPGIIDGDDWLKVQSILKENESKAPRQGSGRTALLSGILKCNMCGSNMRISYKKSKSSSKESSYYICGNKKVNGKSACCCSNLSSNHIDSLILNNISSIDVNKVTNLYDNGNLFDNSIFKSELDIVDKSINEKQKKFDSLINKLSLTENEIVITNIMKNMENLAQDIENLSLEKNSLINKISNISKQDIDDIEYYINKFDIFLNKQSIEYKREFVSSIIDKILWDSDSNTISVIFKNI